jgi:hypothetical protein
MNNPTEDKVAQEAVNQVSLDRAARRDLDGAKDKGKGKLFGQRNALLCRARVAKRAGKMDESRKALEEARRIAPLTFKEQAGYDRA